MYLRPYVVLYFASNFQELLLQSYYGPTGLNYNLGRLNMGGCDFSTRPYTYCDVEDPELNKFNLTEDDIIYKVIYSTK